MRISDWSSEVCSSDLLPQVIRQRQAPMSAPNDQYALPTGACDTEPTRDMTYAEPVRHNGSHDDAEGQGRSEEHTSELQSLMRISYAVFCLKKKKTQSHQYHTNSSTN